MNSTEMKEKRSALIADAQKLMFGENVTAETRSTVEQMLADADAMTKVIAQAEAEETRSAEQRAKALDLPNPGEAQKSIETRSDEQVKASFRSFLQTGKVETRDLTVSADGVLIPTTVAQPVIAQKSAGQIYDVIGKMTTATGAPIKMPYINDTANGFVLNSTAIDTTDPAVTGITLNVDEYRANPILLDNSLIQDSAFDLAGFVTRAIYERYQRDISKHVTIGNSSNIGGLTAITAGVETAGSGAIAYADFVSMLATLDPAYASNACWTMSTSTLGAVLKIVDGNQRPIFVPFTDGANSGFVGQILGFPVKINQYLPAVAAGNVAVQFGDMKAGYVLREVQPGIVVRRLEERYAEKNQTGIVAFTRVGGAVLDAGTHPILSLKIKA